MNLSIGRIKTNLYRQIREHINRTLKLVKSEEDNVTKNNQNPTVIKKEIEKNRQQHSQKDCTCFKKRFLASKFGVNTVPCEHCIYSKDYKKMNSLEHFGISDEIPRSVIKDEKSKSRKFMHLAALKDFLISFP